jgi:DNA ligase-1
MRKQVPVLYMAFDVLFQGEELLLSLPLVERRARLQETVARLASSAMSPIERDERADAAQRGLFTQVEDVAVPVPRLVISPAHMVESAEQIDQAYRDARERANEGVMLKAADSVYQPGRRGLAWVKLKRELATLDVVITGAEFGHGRRAGLLSDYTFAVRGASPPGEPMELLNVGKAYSGVTDAEIAELTAWLQEHTLEDQGHFRTVEPLRVIEVAFNNVMRSDRHASGFALRFPRILRIRDDKPVAEIDTLERVAEIYESQPDKVASPK